LLVLEGKPDGYAKAIQDCDSSNYYGRIWARIILGLDLSYLDESHKTCPWKMISLSFTHASFFQRIHENSSV